MTGSMRQRVKAVVLVAAAVLGFSGCATLRPVVAVSPFGAVDPGREAQLGEDALALEQTPDVAIVQGQLPAGLQLDDAGSKLVVLPGFEDRYAILGSIEADYMPLQSKAMVNNLFGAWKYEERWRRDLCYWQVPLKVVTMGVWSYAVPLNYPCIGKIPGKEDLRKLALVERMKRGAAALDGNLVILVGGTTTTLVTGNQYGVSTSVIPWSAARGYVVLDRSSGSNPAEVAGTP